MAEMSLEERFYNKVIKHDNGCHIWTASKNADGYGCITVDRKNLRAHRVSYILNKGKIPEGLLVCHTCDNPSCVNPDHLFLGTRKDNSIDMAKKGRARNSDGALNPNAKLDPLSVRIIKDCLKAGFYQKDIARYFNVSQVSVSRIKINETWRCLNHG